VVDWDGTEYRRVNSLQHWLANRALSVLHLEGVQSLLDVGCGDGRITSAIADRMAGATVIGIDPSPRMISEAPASNKVTFRVGDVCGMLYEDEFDAVVSFNALHWVLDQRGALTRIAAAVRRPGWALLVFVCAGERPSLEQVAMLVTSRESWRRYFTHFTAPFMHPTTAAWAATASACGLQVVDKLVEDLSWDFESTDAFVDWCTVGFGAWTERLPNSAISAFVTDVLRGGHRVITDLSLLAVADEARQVGLASQLTS
jgi:trans-aconitate 2-methyltransferase